MIEPTLEITEVVNTLEILGGPETILEVSPQISIGIIAIAEQGPAGPPGGPGGGGIGAVEEDTSPSLGGHLVLGSYNIIGTLENDTLIIDGGLL